MHMMHAQRHRPQMFRRLLENWHETTTNTLSVGVAAAESGSYRGTTQAREVLRRYFLLVNRRHPLGETFRKNPVFDETSIPPRICDPCPSTGPSVPHR